MTTTTTPAARFRGYAETERRFAEKKRNNGTQHQNPTRRRLEMLRGTELDARRADERQGAFLGLADGWDADTLPGILRGLRTKAQVEALVYIAYGNYPNWDSTLAEAGLTEQTYLGAAQALTHVAIDVSRIDPIEQQIKEAKRALWGHDIPGFFPTPDELAERLVRLADIRAGMRVLEPSAGWGNIADAVRRLHPDVQLDVCEINHNLQAILKLKGYSIFADNVMVRIPEEPGYARWDRVCANPPFEQLRDIDHVIHYYHLLRPGGRLVSIMSPSPFFHSSTKARAFRDWLVQVGAQVEALPDGSFAKGERPTNVATRLVVIDR